MSTPDLLPCPFCGGKAEFLPTDPPTEVSVGCFSSKCPLADVATEWTDRETAAAYWNTRATPPVANPSGVGAQGECGSCGEPNWRHCADNEHGECVLVTDIGAPAAHPPEGGTPPVRECPLPCVLQPGHEGLHRLALPVNASWPTVNAAMAPAAPPAKRRPQVGEAVEVFMAGEGSWNRDRPLPATVFEVVADEFAKAFLRARSEQGTHNRYLDDEGTSWRWPEAETKWEG